MKSKTKMQSKKLKNEFDFQLRSFNKLFPSDAHCFRELWRRTYHTDVAVCRFCNTSQSDFCFDKRTFKCKHCRGKNSVTAGTFFEKIRRPRPWLARIWFFENGIQINSNQFSELFDIAYSTSLSIFKKITLAVIDMLPAETECPSSDFEELICKRSSETPANEHPKSELRTGIEDNEVSVSEIVGELDANDSVILELLQGGRLSTDQLHYRSKFSFGELYMSLFTLCDLRLVRRLPGDLYERVSLQQVKINRRASERSAQIDSATEFIRVTNHGISRKYLQLYVCAAAIHSNRKRWSSGALLKACCASVEITDAQVRAYVSPYNVRVA